MIVTMDANFGLVRKRSSGMSMTQPLQGNSMFVKDEDVEDYLLSEPDHSKPSEVSDWHVCLAIPVVSVVCNPNFLFMWSLIYET